MFTNKTPAGRHATFACCTFISICKTKIREKDPWWGLKPAAFSVTNQRDIPAGHGSVPGAWHSGASRWPI